MGDTIIQSLLRGRGLATVAATISGVSSLSDALTGVVNETTLVINAVTALVAAVAALSSKIREIRKGKANG